MIIKPTNPLSLSLFQHQRYNRIEHVLIVAPTTLLINWRQEFKKWTGFDLTIDTIDGSVLATKRIQVIKRVQATSGVLMVTYNLARTLMEDLSNFRGSPFKWDYIILDEAHKIKNQSKTTREINQLPSRLRLAITGTPVQNNLSELWSIFNFTMQGGLLGTYTTFNRSYEKPITLSRQKDASDHQKILGNKIAKSLREIIDPYLLRRTKEQIFNINSEPSGQPANGEQDSKRLPPKYDWCVWIRMNEIQIKLYEDFLNSDEVKEILALRHDAVKSPLLQLLVMKKICDHPRLLSKNTFEKLVYDDEQAEQLTHLDVPVDLLLKESAKLSVLSKLTRVLIGEQRKILIFSDSTKMLDMIEKVLKLNKWRYCRLDGQIKSNEKREEIVRRFQTDASLPIMLLTIQVGGVGLTLTAASRVILCKLGRLLTEQWFCPFFS